jgi:ATP-dependent helicase/nuclease subunit A
MTKDAARLLAETDHAQSLASDPAASAWVSANAGAGKTHVLKRRVLRLLVTGTAPDRILCLTYTKAAAAEMSSRVFGDLAGWATADPQKLRSLLADVLARNPTSEEEERARTMFARAIETPGGLKVQTIHAFCERLLQRFALEAGVPPAFAILDEDESRKLLRQSIDRMLVAATRGSRHDLANSLQAAITYAQGDAFDAALDAALKQRQWLTTVDRLALIADDPFDHARQIYCEAINIRPELTEAGLDDAMGKVLSEAAMRRAVQALSSGSKTDQQRADSLAAALSAREGRARVEALKAALLTKDGEPRKQVVTKTIQQDCPDVQATLERARDMLAELVHDSLGLSVVEATVALMRLACEVMQDVSTAKTVRAALDFDDLIQHSVSLLATSGASAWVLYKLDGGIDHVLVDEAQDTSPEQWQLVQSLTEEFFAGSGAREELVRTVFAVGDEKQSIFSFQGAAPHKFREAGLNFETAAKRAAAQWHSVPLTLSFRTVEPVLAAVDRVFADRHRTPGVASSAAGVRHLAKRIGHAGLVEVWPTIAPDDAEPSEPWSPLADKGLGSPAVRLANRIADTIDGWIKTGERLISEDRPIRAGDMLILVRRRRPFANAMVRALKARGIPVAGADRLELKDQIAAQDIIALCEFVSLPEDDLALACVLKGPLFGLADDDLLRIAPARKGMLWSALLAAAKDDARFWDAAERLKRWRRQADLDPPFEFLSGILDRDGGRKRLIAQLGPDAVDPIAELLNLALKYDDRAPASLVGFLDWLSTGSHQVRRDMEQGRDEVRVMTVHGAKGLEAPIVFLPDTCSSGSGRRQGELLALDGQSLDWPGEANDPPYAWPVKGASRHAAIKAASERARALEAEERNRLLYVAMTRARDRLYVAGFETAKGRDKNCWYDLIVAGLDGLAERVEFPDGPGLRLVQTQKVAPEPTKVKVAAPQTAMPLPEWASRPTPREVRMAVPLAPSRLAPLDIDETGDPVAAQPADTRGSRKADAPSSSPLRMAGEHRFLRGTITHALLEHLPTFEPARWEAAARQFVDRRGAVLPPRVRSGIVNETLAIIRDRTFAAVFGAQSRAEVSIVAEIAPPGSGGQPLRITGQIDRLVATKDEVLIVDYKTNRPPPREPEQVAQAYLLQLAAYRLAVQGIVGKLPVRAAILWTDGPRLMPIPPELLDRAEGELWSLPSRRAAG